MPTIKNPTAPATGPQLGFIRTLANEKGYDLSTSSLDMDTLTKGQASALIGVLKDYVAPTAPKQSLEDVAAALTAKPDLPFTAESDRPVASLTVAQIRRALTWFSVLGAELDPTEADEELAASLELALTLATTPEEPVVAPKTVAPKTADSMGIVAGHYAIGEPGETKFYRVTYGKQGGTWAGFCFVDVQASDDYYPVKGASKFDVLEAIKADPYAAAKRYGMEIGRCFKCHKTLTKAESLEDGMGADCKRSLGL